MATLASVPETASLVTTSTFSSVIATSAGTSCAPTNVPATSVSYTAIVSAIQAAVRKETDSAVARALPAMSLPAVSLPTMSRSGAAALTLPSTQAASDKRARRIWPELAAYGQIVMNLTQRHGGRGWLSYDRLFRQQAAAGSDAP
uniref:Uncharacterized protein n=1 Tax=Amphimedon queenslandica TaxID=400682 RepID=A0A1X7VXP8_AMPQE